MCHSCAIFVVCIVWLHCSPSSLPPQCIFFFAAVGICCECSFVRDLRQIQGSCNRQPALARILFSGGRQHCSCVCQIKPRVSKSDYISSNYSCYMQRADCTPKLPTTVWPAHSNMIGFGCLHRSFPHLSHTSLLTIRVTVLTCIIY